MKPSPLPHPTSPLPAPLTPAPASAPGFGSANSVPSPPAAALLHPPASGGLSILDDVYALERDPGVQVLIRHGWTMGCFYIESPSMRSLFEKLRCATFEGVVAASSIIRPGVAESGMMQEYVARATGRRKTTYLHPVMEELLGDTYGVMVYQEDVLKVAHALGGLTLPEADLLRRAMSGKSRSKDAMDRLHRKFFESCRARGLDDRLTQEIWRQIESFAAYSFCKGHSAAFAVLSFQMAWFKAHYPAEFLASVIANGGGFYSTAAYVQEARRLGIVVEGPCVNQSRLDWWGETARQPNQPEWWERRARSGNGKWEMEKAKKKKRRETERTRSKEQRAKNNKQENSASPAQNALPLRPQRTLREISSSLSPHDGQTKSKERRTENKEEATKSKEPVADRGAQLTTNNTDHPAGTLPPPITGMIRAGLLAVAGLSPDLVTRILDERKRNGPYRTPEDFWNRSRPTPDEAERLILCGAMDGFGVVRARLMMRHALWQRAREHDSPLAPWDGSLPEWAREESAPPEPIPPKPAEAAVAANATTATADAAENRR